VVLTGLYLYFEEDTLELLIIAGIDLSHERLVDLAYLADQAEPFYRWVEGRFQRVLSRQASLDDILQTSSLDGLKSGIADCYYQKASQETLPALFDGVGRNYPHARACFYFFSWMIRDAPQQRLAPLIQRIQRSTGQTREDIEIEVLARMIFQYRPVVKTFAWQAMREVIIDRLEGSRRSIKGHEKEALLRLALLKSFQRFFNEHQNYGLYAAFKIPSRQIVLENESYDVSVSLLGLHGEVVRRILLPIKTRETEGGGHAHLFTRDIKAALTKVRRASPDDLVCVVIIAKNWSE
jgi:hypothetical protein